MTKIKLLNQASEKDILRQWGWTISTFRNIMLQIHDKDTTSETSIRKWYFSAMRMNNLTFRNIMLQIHDKDTTSETNIRKWYFSAMRMNNLMFRNIMLQTHNKDTTKQASKTSFRRWYFRQWRWTIWCSEISWKRNNSVVQRWIFDKYLSTHTSTIFVTSRQKKHPPWPAEKILIGELCSRRGGFNLFEIGNILSSTTLSQKSNGRYMALRWKIDRFL